MTERTAAAIYADQDARIAAALARVPPHIAALINASQQRFGLAFALVALFEASTRESIGRAASYLEGFACAVFGSTESAWGAAEWNDLQAHIHLLESTALARLVEE